MPDGLLARVEEAVKESAETVNAFIVAAIEEHLTRREGGSTALPAKAGGGSTTRSRKPREDTAPAATFKQAEPEGASDIAAFFRRRNGDQS